MLNIRYEAGLPNITGHVGGSVNANNPPKGGALYYVVERQIRNNFGAGTGTPIMTFHIDASLSNPIYGASNTVQPSSISTLLILKY